MYKLKLPVIGARRRKNRRLRRGFLVRAVRPFAANEAVILANFTAAGREAITSLFPLFARTFIAPLKFARASGSSRGKGIRARALARHSRAARESIARCLTPRIPLTYHCRAMNRCVGDHRVT